ncbi:bile acid:sodium symporter family protein [Marinobacterium weihaiense]|uniref:Bile acid:sodium symporter family protein n=1 Tax=Marinobacterium weihaiense TaxID=2851016 RepID=A0ABS6MDY9_9GAMM|nr:bile acid:sodium symporter family protein [Marinobacterium weihaiense]MBV0934505.1 bile acid:sodium symporter family protein [Marinobacterium weihaiense]
MLNRITQLFPAWAILFSVVAYLQPALFTELKSSIVPLLTAIMLAMGLTLTPMDFRNVLRFRSAIGIGVLLQFSVMPLLALGISLVLGFDTDQTVGMVLVGAVAGGTSSNVMTFLAGGNLALSISMTALSTLLGVVLTPLLTGLLVGQTVDVPISGMLMSLVKIVLIPVAIGVAINAVARERIKRIDPVLPLVSMVSIVMIIAIVVALNKDNLASQGAIIALAVMLHNGLGLAAGYGACRACGFDSTISRTIAFEVGLQNSGLATALAMKFFTPIAAIPGTIFSVWHNISGSILAGYWSRKPVIPAPARETERA